MGRRSLKLGLSLALALTAGCASVGMPGEPPSPDLPPLPTGPELADPAPREAPPRDGTLPALTLPPETGDVRALWVVRTALLHPDSARTAVRRADDAGFNTLLVQVRGRGDAYFASALEPRAEPLAGAPADYDPLATVLDEAGRRGLRVHAWMNMHVVASAVLPPEDPAHIANERPEWLAVPRALGPELFGRDPGSPAYLEALLAYTRANSSRVEGLYTSPTHPAVQAHLQAVVEDLLARYPVDGVHLDYLRFPAPEFDYSRATLEAFRDWIHRADGLVGAGELRAAEAQWLDDVFAFTDAFPAEWDAFRRAGVTATMERIYRAAKAGRPDLVVSAAVFADADDAHRSRFQEWERWLASGIVDVAAPMAYTTDDAVFRSQIARAASAADPGRVWAGLGIYRDSFEGAVDKGRLARELGVGGLALFSYDWAVGPEGTEAADGDPYLFRFSGAAFGR